MKQIKEITWLARLILHQNSKCSNVLCWNATSDLKCVIFTFHMALLFLRREKLASSSPSSFLQYGDKRFQVTSNPENGIFLPSPFTEHLSHKLSLKQNSGVDERPFFSRSAVGPQLRLHNARLSGAQLQLNRTWINRPIFAIKKLHFRNVGWPAQFVFYEESEGIVE